MKNSPPARSGSYLSSLLLKLHRLKTHRSILKTGLVSRGRSFEGIRFHYYTTNNGKPPLVLLHGFLDDARTFRRSFARLSENFDLYALDIPGFGRSRLPEIRDLWDTRVFARFLGRFLVFELGLREVPALAHSMGAQTAVHMAEFMKRVYGTRVFSRLHLVAPGILKMKAAERDERRKLLFPRTAEEIRTLLASLYSKELPEISDFLLQGLLYEWTKPGYHYLAENTIAEESDVFFSPARLRALRVPLTLYWGKDDRITPPALGRAMQRAAGGTRLRLFPNAGHALHHEIALEFTQAFLEECGDERKKRPRSNH